LKEQSLHTISRVELPTTLLMNVQLILKGHRKRATYRKARMNTLPMPYTDPTQRVFDATQQDCKPKHLFHLAKANKFDFSSTLKTGRAGIDCIAVSDVSVEGTSPTGELESIEGRVPDYITLLA
jgi:hypothetical protein